MARTPFWRRKPKKAETRISDNWDLKGTALLDVLAANTGLSAITPKSAMKVSGVLAAVSLRSGLLASFPKAIFERTGDGRKEIVDDPLHKIIAYQPNPFMNAFTFWELVNTHLDLWGNAYVYITRYKQLVSALTPIDPDKVEMFTENGKLIYKVKDTGDKILDGNHSPQKILHFKDISFNGFKGLSRVSLANDTINLCRSAEKFGLEFFDKGGHSKGMIEMEGQMSPDAFKAFKAQWDQNANYGVPILDMGKKYKEITIPMSDAQFIATREFQIQDIARIFGVPPHLLSDLSRATYSNIEHSDLSFVKYGLRPMVKRYEHELESKLLGEDLGKKFIRFNLDGMLRGDTAARASYMAAMKQNELYTTNEIRVANGTNPSDDPKADLLENPNTTSNTKPNED